MVKFSQKITGTERKNIAAIIAEATGEQVKYAGVPSYAYVIGGWSINRDSVVHSLTFDSTTIGDFKAVLDALSLAGLTAEGDLSITISAQDHTEATRQNLSALIASKANLLGKALARHTGQDWVVCGDDETELIFPYFNATLSFDEVNAY